MVKQPFAAIRSPQATRAIGWMPPPSVVKGFKLFKQRLFQAQ